MQYESLTPSLLHDTFAAAPSPALKSYLFERRVVMNSATLRSEAGPLKNFAVLLSHETVRNFAARRGPPILVDVVKAISQFMR